MLSLELPGYYTDEPGAQKHPFPFSWFYKDTGNFVGFVADLSSHPWFARQSEHIKGSVTNENYYVLSPTPLIYSPGHQPSQSL